MYFFYFQWDIFNKFNYYTSTKKCKEILNLQYNMKNLDISHVYVMHHSWKYEKTIEQVYNIYTDTNKTHILVHISFVLKTRKHIRYKYMHKYIHTYLKTKEQIKNNHNKTQNKTHKYM